METPVCADFGAQARAVCDGAKGVCLIVITAVLESQRVEGGRVWGLIEDEG